MKDREDQLKTKINGLEYSLATTNITNNNLHKEKDKLANSKQKLTEEVFDLHSELHERNDLKQPRTTKVVTEDKNKNNIWFALG